MGVRLICVYCGRELPDQRTPCCGEVGHTEEVDEGDNEWTPETTTTSGGSSSMPMPPATTT